MTPEDKSPRPMTQGEETLLGGHRSHGNAASAGTLATYEQIALIYFDKWNDRSAIHEQLVRFVDMMRVYGLTDLPVADIGCGPGFDAHLFREAGLYAIGADLSPAMMCAGRPEYGGDYVQADMRHLPLAARFGGLWVSASMLHVPRDEVPTVLAGFARVLVPGGLLYLSLKAGEGAEWTNESHGQPLSRYFTYWSPDELDQILREAGFQTVDGWVSPAVKGTTWLIRFARNASGGPIVPLTLS